MKYTKKEVMKAVVILRNYCKESKCSDCFLQDIDTRVCGVLEQHPYNYPISSMRGTQLDET